MAEIKLPDGTRVTGRTLELQTSDGRRVTATDGEFDLSQNGNQVRIRVSNSLMGKLLRILNDVVSATLLTDSGRSLVQVIVTSATEMRAEGFGTELQGYIK